MTRRKLTAAELRAAWRRDARPGEKEPSVPELRIRYADDTRRRGPSSRLTAAGEKLAIAGVAILEAANLASGSLPAKSMFALGTAHGLVLRVRDELAKLDGRSS